MPIAIRCGMSLDDFWYNDIDLLDSYVTAYTEDNDYKAWLNGMYSYKATITAIAECFSDGKTKIPPYPNEPYGAKYKANSVTEEQAKVQPKSQNDYDFLSMCF